MSRLKKHAKKSKKEIHQYPWKVESDLFALFSKYCEGLNLSINEGLSLLVQEEVEEFKNDLSDESINEILLEFKNRRNVPFPPNTKKQSSKKRGVENE